MEYTTKEIVKPDTKQVIGLKLKTKPNLVGDKDFKEFLSKCTINFNIILMSEDNELTCKFYDEDTGEIYFHFERPISLKVIEPWFKEEELIYPLDETF